MPNISDNLQSLITAKNNIGDAITSNGGTLSTGRLEGFPNDLNNRFGEVNDTLSILLKGPTLITKNITQNGTYDAEDDNADGYSSVSVNVANSYTNADEGKVVSSGSLIAQTAYPTTITENGTYNTTENNSVMVSVPSLPSGTDMCILTPVSSGITTSEMYAVNIGNATLVFGFFDTTSYGANQIFSYPSSFNFVHTTVCRYWLNAYSGGYAYENYRYYVDTSTRQVYLYRAAGGPTYPLAYYFM